MKTLCLDDYLKALDKMKRSQRDRIGTLGDLGVTGLGVAGGIAVSGASAAAVGVATLAGSTTLASIFGGFLVVTTPVGWVIGSAAVGGALAYGMAALVRSGGKYDTLKALNIRELELRVEQSRKKADRSALREPKLRQVITSVQCLVANGHMTQESATDFIGAVEKEHTSVDEAFDLIQALLKEKTILQPASR